VYRRRENLTAEYRMTKRLDFTPEERKPDRQRANDRRRIMKDGEDEDFKKVRSDRYKRRKGTDRHAHRDAHAHAHRRPRPLSWREVYYKFN
jgi:hypothetical protein